ncbi:MAG: FHA domain-containing protein [Deltaproteobacteria bacterium]|nr:FHA domain-containing protein [Deltaproteobacteria bacterium]
MGPIVGLVGIAALAGVGWFFWQRREGEAETSGRSRPAGRGGGAAAPAAGERVGWLVGVNGDVAGKEFYIGARTATIGRGPANAVQTTDSQASRKHCQLSPQGDRLKVVDMASRNGTLVNGRPVREALLTYGDSIRIGEAELVFMRTAVGGVDAAMERKLANSLALDSTSAGGGGNSSGLSGVIAETLARHDGDLQRAAAELGCDVAFLQRLIAKQTGRGDRGSSS